MKNKETIKESKDWEKEFDKTFLAWDMMLKSVYTPSGMPLEWPVEKIKDFIKQVEFQVYSKGRKDVEQEMINTINEKVAGERDKIEELWGKHCSESHDGSRPDVMFYENGIDALKEYGQYIRQATIEEVKLMKMSKRELLFLALMRDKLVINNHE